MATAIAGKLSEFDPTHNSVTEYVEQVKLFYEANDFSDAKKVVIFLSAMGGRTYGLVRNLLSPENPSEKSFDEIVDIKLHFEPKPPIISERFQFNRRIQAVDETVAEFVAEL